MRQPKQTTLHGVTLSDDYAWLSRKGSPEVLTYLAAENAYTDAATQATKSLQETLFDEMQARVQPEHTSPAVRNGEWSYYRRTIPGNQYSAYYRKRIGQGDSESLLLDLNQLGQATQFIKLDQFEVSDDGNFLAYTVDFVGSRHCTLYVKDLRTNVVQSKTIDDARSLYFAKESNYLFYTKPDPITRRPSRLYLHDTVHVEDPDPLLYEEHDERFELFITRSRSRDFLFITSESHITSETRYIPLATPNAQPVVVAPRASGVMYDVDHLDSHFYIRTNLDAPNFRLMKAPIHDLQPKRWVEVVPNRTDIALVGIDLFSSYGVLWERKDGLQKFRVLDMSTGASHPLEFGEPAYDISEEPNPDFDGDKFRFGFESLITPKSIIEYDMRHHTQRMLDQESVSGGYRADQYESVRVHATAKDGTLIPISMVYRKGAQLDGSHPVLLCGYGAYGWLTTTTFSANRVSLLDRGVIYAVAHVRGGGELGQIWHENGRMEFKENTFNDFIASAEWLIASGWADPRRLAITGKSAGGLLMGAVTNVRPDLWRAVVMNVPFVDLMNTMLDDTLPLTVGEYEEWGNPHIKADFDRMLKYSPYDNIARKNYPSILIRTSYNDSQVMYWESAKYVAKMRALKTDSNLLLFKINMVASGHHGFSNRTQSNAEAAFDYAYILRQFGIDAAPPTKY